MQILIAAFPEAAATLMVVEENDMGQTDEYYRDMFFVPDMTEVINIALEKYPQIDSIYFYGPTIYVKDLAAEAKQIFSSFRVDYSK